MAEIIDFEAFKRRFGPDRAKSSTQTIGNPLFVTPEEAADMIQEALGLTIGESFCDDSKLWPMKGLPHD
jgi:hypothetical protein